MFRSTVPIGRFAGVSVGAHWSVLVVVGLIAQLLAMMVLPQNVPGVSVGWYWTAASLTAVCFMASLLAHELAHAVMARHYGMRVQRITLWMLGGATELDGEPPHPRADLVIAVVGPATSLVIGGACWAAAAAAGGWLPTIVVVSLSWLGLTNVVLAVFNMLPGTPLDGGRVLRAAVWKRTGSRTRAVATASRGGQVLGAVLVAAGLAEMLFFGRMTGLWLALIGWFLIAAAAAERAGGAVRDQLKDTPVSAVMDPKPVTAPGWWTVQTFIDRVAAGAGRRAFPVVSFEGAPVGVVSLADLTRLSPQQRVNTRVSDACRALSGVTVVHGNDRVIDVITRAPLRQGRDLILVVDDGVLAGVISPEDITRTMELAALGHQVGATPRWSTP